MRQLITLILIACGLAPVAMPLHAQDAAYARKIIDTLTAPYFAGRGYVADGMPKAAAYIATEMKAIGLKPLFKRDYLQKFPMAVNAFPGKMQVELDARLLKPGEDYIVDPASSGFAKQSLKAFYADSAYVAGLFAKKGGLPVQKEAMAAVIDKKVLKGYNHDTLLIYLNKAGMKLLVETTGGKLTWSASQWVEPFPQILVKQDALADSPKVISVEIDEVYWPRGSFNSQNVGGYIKGKDNPDSFILITAHYDHLGMMGKEAMFPGANDNASGTAIMLDLARYYSKKENQPAYSIAFVAFGAEEAGLLGSQYFVENPPMPLKKMAIVVNMDLMANGQDGMTVVNATVFPGQFLTLTEINDARQYLKEIRSRGKAANSDHYWFSEKGVPAFFFYLMGEYPYYHDIYDTKDKPSMAGYDGAFKLIRDFVGTYK